MWVVVCWLSFSGSSGSLVFTFSFRFANAVLPPSVVVLLIGIVVSGAFKFSLRLLGPFSSKCWVVVAYSWLLTWYARIVFMVAMSGCLALISLLV